MNFWMGFQRFRRLRRRMQKDKEPKEIKHLLKERAAKAYEEKEAQFPEAEHLAEVERVFLLRVIDAKWMDHTLMIWISYVRESVCRLYGQREIPLG